MKQMAILTGFFLVLLMISVMPPVLATEAGIKAAEYAEAAGAGGEQNINKSRFEEGKVKRGFPLDSIMLLLASGLAMYLEIRRVRSRRRSEAQRMEI